MFRSLLCSVLLLLGGGLEAMAQESHSVIVWEPGAGYPRMILPAVTGMSPDEVVRRYLHALETHPDLGPVRSVKTHGAIKITTEAPDLAIPVGHAHVENWSATPNSRILLVAGHADMMKYADSGGIGKQMARIYRDHFTADGGDFYVLPPASFLAIPDERPFPEDATKFRLSENQRAYFQDLGSGIFQGIQLPGGHDWHPALYGEPIAGAMPDQLSFTRDLGDIALAQAAIHQGRARLAGICRGSQGCWIALGGTLVQDVSGHLSIDTETKSPGPGHENTLLDPDHFSVAHLINDSRTNSVHHQMVDAAKIPEGVRVIAHAKDQPEVVEVWVSGHNVLAYQSHPELERQGAAAKNMSVIGQWMLSHDELPAFRPCLEKRVDESIR